MKQANLSQRKEETSEKKQMLQAAMAGFAIPEIAASVLLAFQQKRNTCCIQPCGVWFGRGLCQYWPMHDTKSFIFGRPWVGI